MKKEELSNCWCFATPINVNKLIQMGFPFVSSFPNNRFTPITLTIRLDGVGQSTFPSWEDKTQVEVKNGEFCKVSEKVHLCTTCDDEIKDKCSTYRYMEMNTPMFECSDYVKSKDKHLCDTCTLIGCQPGKKHRLVQLVHQCGFHNAEEDIKVTQQHKTPIQKQRDEKDDSKATTNFSSRFMSNVKFKSLPDDADINERFRLSSFFAKHTSDDKLFYGYRTNWCGDIIYNGFEDQNIMDDYAGNAKLEVSVYQAVPELIPKDMRYNKELDKLVPDVLDEDLGFISAEMAGHGSHSRCSHQNSEKEIVDAPTKNSGGDGNSYYDLPMGATQLQDLIECKNMNGNIKDVFKACYRIGEKDGTENIYDVEKMVYYSIRELGRLLNTKDYVALAEKILGKQNIKGEK